MTQQVNDMGYTKSDLPDESYDKKAHPGWKEEEDALLFEEVKRAREEGRPLKSVFDAVAKKTGRKPNSIRNYYYVRVRDQELAGIYLGSATGHSTAFVPFTEDEVREMLRVILAEQARGVSVRACTLNMGGNDNKAMLRFQNKYRSVIKNNPKLVHEVIDELRAEGVEAFDPYMDKPVKALGRPRRSRRTNIVDLLSETVSRLEQVEGVDVASFFENISALALSANRGAAAIKRLEEAEGEGSTNVPGLIAENRELRELASGQLKELKLQKERFSALLSLFRQLMDVNRSFLGLTSVVKVSSLGTYIRELSRNVEDCEKLIVEYMK